MLRLTTIILAFAAVRASGWVQNWNFNALILARPLWCLFFIIFIFQLLDLLFHLKLSKDCKEAFLHDNLRLVVLVYQGDHFFEVGQALKQLSLANFSQLSRCYLKLTTIKYEVSKIKRIFNLFIISVPYLYLHLFRLDLLVGQTFILFLFYCWKWCDLVGKGNPRATLHD